jgi:hypothetical protein
MTRSGFEPWLPRWEKPATNRLSYGTAFVFISPFRYDIFICTRIRLGMLLFRLIQRNMSTETARVITPIRPYTYISMYDIPFRIYTRQMHIPIPSMSPSLRAIAHHERYISK